MFKEQAWLLLFLPELLVSTAGSGLPNGSVCWLCRQDQGLAGENCIALASFALTRWIAVALQGEWTLQSIGRRALVGHTVHAPEKSDIRQMLVSLLRLSYQRTGTYSLPGRVPIPGK